MMAEQPVRERLVRDTVGENDGAAVLVVAA